MKVLIAVSCLLAVASAGFVGHSAYSYPYAAYANYAGAQHLPVIGPNGVPVDEPAVQARRAEHAAAYVEASARNGDAVLVGEYNIHGAVVAPVAYAAQYYAGPQHLPVIGANGVPVDEPAVQARRAEHAAAYVEASARNGDAVLVGHGAVVAPVAYAGQYYAGPQHLPVIGANGVPVDEPAVQVARAEHAASHIEAKVRNGDAAVVGAVAYAGHHVAAPVVAHANGAIVPADTVEVAAARAEHFAAHAEANARNGVYQYAPLVHYRKRRGVLGYGAPIAYSAPLAYATGHVYGGPQHLPVIGANGVPVDEPAVQVARAEHAASHVEAQVRNGDAAVLGYSAHQVVAPVAYSAGPVVQYGAQHLPVIGANGVPVDEPAVQVARAAHAAHRVEAEVRNGDAGVVAYGAHHIAAPAVYASPVVAHANGAVVPAETVEVAAARAAHYAAHVEAKVRNGDLHQVVAY